MELSYLPALVLLFIILLSNPEPPVAATKKQARKPIAKQAKVESKYTDRELEYLTIHDYIRKKFRHIPSSDVKEIATHLVDISREHDLDPKFAAAVMARESGFNKRAISRTGAKGLGQIKDFNYKSLGIKNPYDIKQNVGGTVKYLKRMLSRWQGKSEKVSLALASYYKGYGAVKRAGEKYDKKTDGYVKDILSYYDKISSLKENYRKPEEPTASK